MKPIVPSLTRPCLCHPPSSFGVCRLASLQEKAAGDCRTPRRYRDFQASSEFREVFGFAILYPLFRRLCRLAVKPCAFSPILRHSNTPLFRIHACTRLFTLNFEKYFAATRDSHAEISLFFAARLRIIRFQFPMNFTGMIIELCH
ncbi:MAG TPA: hypothetical protein VG754_04880 [Verrucomicrobiae bacterium]|nr:hypothetical protein [Verrucomicrobiae bacterium]